MAARPSGSTGFRSACRAAIPPPAIPAREAHPLNAGAALFRVLAPLRDRALSLTGWRTLGVRALVLGHDGRIALIRHTYTGNALYMPGGGVGRGESFRTALPRELAEEIGVTRFHVDRLLGVYHDRTDGRDDHIAVYVVTLDAQQTRAAHAADSREIAALVWTNPDTLPENATPATRARVAEWRNDEVGGAVW